LRISENINFTNDDVMKHVVGALEWKLPRARYPIIGFCTWASEGGPGEHWPPLDFEIFSKKGCFLSFECEKLNFTTFGSTGKIEEKSPCGPRLEKSFRRPCKYS